MKNKNLLVICIGLLGLIISLVINYYIENDLLCIFLMIVFLLIEIYGLSNIIKDKRIYR